MSLASAERRVERALASTPLASVVDPRRLIRFVEYIAVGASGAVLDVGLTASTLSLTHYLVANAIGFLVANTWNFGLNHRFTFDSPEGSLLRQYPAYLAWHVATFVVRATTIAVLVETAGTPVLVASTIGIGTAAVANFGGSEVIFGTSTVSPAELRASFGRTLNRVVHALYTGRIRRFINGAGLYAPLYGAYQRVLGWFYLPDVIDVELGGATARFHMEHDAEILSVLHTLRKEDEMVADFASSVKPGDVVWDVGANLGVFALLAADKAEDGHVVAFEPYPPNVSRLQENIALNGASGAVDVADVALGSGPGQIELGIDRRELGTQTPTVNARPDQTVTQVDQIAGDAFVDTEIAPAPDVVKVDVEGAELDVLDGLQDVLDDARLVYVEDHSCLWGGQDASDQLQARLTRHGFDVEKERQGGQTYFRGTRA